MLKSVGLTSMTDYSPYGSILQRYAFQGRRTRFMTTYYERDSSTLLDYRGVRFIDAEVGGFLSLDPLAGERTWVSPYNYVQCNPVLRIDPTGMLDDTYGVDSKGNITKIDDKKYYDKDGNEVDLLVVGNKVRYNKKGDIKNGHIYVKSGFLRQGLRNHSFRDVQGNTYGYSHIGFGDNESESIKTFEFLADNTNVEWGLMQTNVFGRTNNELFTSHLFDEERAAGSLILDKRDPSKLQNLIYDYHSHPPTYKMGDESRLRPSDEDKDFAKRVRAQNSSAVFKVYFNGKYLEY